MSALQSAHIFYEGIVQGVGFRFTAQRIACEIGLRGWVRNLRDGRVEVLAEGEPGEIERLMAELEVRFTGSIRNRDVTLEAADGRYADFRIIG